MQRVWKSTTSVCSLRCSGTFSGANRMALLSHLCPAFLPEVRAASFPDFEASVSSLRFCFSYFPAVLTLMSLLPFCSPWTVSKTVVSFRSSLTLGCLGSPTPLDFGSFSSVLSLSCEPLLLLDPVFRCLYRGGVRGVSSRPLYSGE